MHDDIKKIAAQSLDLTSLNDTDTDDTIRTLCQRALTPLGHVAAVCVFPEFVGVAKECLQDTDIQVATVVNFPSGNEALNDVIAEVKQALFDSADEIDVVFPYEFYLAGERDYCIDFIRQVKKACGHRLLKVILESGAFSSMEVLAAASHDALTAGADFLKTSTGKIAEGATLEAARVMLTAIKSFDAHRVIGFKVSGGVRTTEDAAHYIQLARDIMGEDWVSARTFRIGASGLLDHLLKGTVSTGHY